MLRFNWEDNYNSLAFSCWKIMIKKRFTLGDDSNESYKLGKCLYDITNNWPKEWKKKIYRFCQSKPLKQKRLINKIFMV